MLDILLITVTISVCILTLVSFVVYRKLGIGKALSFLISLPTAIVIANLVINAAIACDRYIFLKNALQNSLKPKDFAGIKPNRYFCPGEYSYTRDGKKEWAINYGDTVMYIDEKNLP